MPCRFIILISVLLWGSTTLSQPAHADTTLTRAEVKSLRNLVQLMPQKKAARPAKVADGIVPGDALSTGREALAELRFNDGSLARIGEQALFRFSAQNRNLKLSNGTALLLIPPGQGTTEVWTPNAAAAIRGSALFVRYISDSKTTVVGALTNSHIEVFNQKISQRQVLKAGQLAVVVKGKITGLYNFDLKTFYETSDLVGGLNLNKKSDVKDSAIAQVQAETMAAVAAQSPLVGKEIIVNPSFVRRSDAEPTSLSLQQDSQNPLINHSESITESIDNGTTIIERPEFLPANPSSSLGNGSISTGDRGSSTIGENQPITSENGTGNSNSSGSDNSLSNNSNLGNNGIGGGNGGSTNNNSSSGSDNSLSNNSNLGNNGIGDSNGSDTDNNSDKDKDKNGISDRKGGGTDNNSDEDNNGNNDNGDNDNGDNDK